MRACLVKQGSTNKDFESLKIVSVLSSGLYRSRLCLMSLSINGGSNHAPHQDIVEDKASTIRRPSFEISDHDVSDTENDEHPGDYSTRMEELFDYEEDDDEFRAKDDNEEDDQEGFLYTGSDAADVLTGYQEQLRDVLGSELSDDDQLEAHEVERSLIVDDDTTGIHSHDNEPLVSCQHEYNGVIWMLIFPLGTCRRPFGPRTFDVVNWYINTSEDEFPRR